MNQRDYNNELQYNMTTRGGALNVCLRLAPQLAAEALPKCDGYIAYNSQACKSLETSIVGVHAQS